MMSSANTIRVVPNISPNRNTPLTADEKAIVGTPAVETVRGFLGAFPNYSPTPLVRLPALAQSLGVGGIDLKYEGHRYGLSSFKALGGAYAAARLVHRFLETQLGRKVAPEEMLSDECRAVAAQLTLSCATDGNHGRSLAAGAQTFGCRCVIFLHAGVSEGRERAIAEFGAEIRRTEGNYDQSIVAANETAAREGWTIVSDFSWDGYEEIPGLVMQGYSLMLEEIIEQAREPYTHIFVQGGVGGVAAAIAGHFHDRFGADRPRLVVVEPDEANCLQRSAEADRRMAMKPGRSTIMAMLECYEPSLVAWRILEKCADDYIAIPDSAAIAAMRTLATPKGEDPELVIGESGGSGLAGLTCALADPSARAALGLDENSNVLLFGTEGASDPAIYDELVHGKAA